MKTESTLDQYFSNWTLSSLLVKVTNVCNFKCRYCFWFSNCKNGDVPDFLSEEIENYLIQKLGKYFADNEKKMFKITFHGGEPLLWGVSRFSNFIEKLNAVASITNTKMRYSIQTNGSLIDEEWVRFFKKYKIMLGISFDGPKNIQDMNRVYANGMPTHSDVCNSIDLLRLTGVDFGVLAVCNPLESPSEILRYFVDELKIKSFDILVPDITHDSLNKQSIKTFYVGLFDDWVQNYLKHGVRVRFIEDIIRSLSYLGSTCETIGYGPMNVFTMETNGDIGPTDTLVICGDHYWNPTMNIINSDFKNIKTNSFIRDSILGSLILSEKCIKCKFSVECGGGCLPHRWSKENKFNNPSIYCSDLFSILEHVGKAIAEGKVCVGL